MGDERVSDIMDDLRAHLDARAGVERTYYASHPDVLIRRARDEIERLRAERDMWRQENLKKQIACEQMGARIVALEWAVIAARREGVEAAIAVASQRAASRHNEATHCVSDRSKKHMQIRADEAGQLVADIRALLENNYD